MATANKVHVLDCGAMSGDLTWLLLKPGRSIRPRTERDRPVEWYPCTTHAVLVESGDGTLLWDTSCPRDWETRWKPTGLQEFFPYDQVSEERRRAGLTHEGAYESRPLRQGDMPLAAAHGDSHDGGRALPLARPATTTDRAKAMEA